MWWYGICAFAPIPWFVATNTKVSWPPHLMEIVVNTAFLTIGAVGAIKTARLAKRAPLRVAAGVAGALYVALLGLSLAYHSGIRL